MFPTSYSAGREVDLCSYPARAFLLPASGSNVIFPAGALTCREHHPGGGVSGTLSCVGPHGMGSPWPVSGSRRTDHHKAYGVRVYLPYT